VATRRVVRCRAEQAAVAATAPPAAPANGTTKHEELQQYGVFRLAYDTANVRAVLVTPGASGVSVCCCRRLCLHPARMMNAATPSPLIDPLLTPLSAATLPHPPPTQEDASLTKNWQKTVRVAVTGASGQIANHLLFMVGARPVAGRLAVELGDGRAHARVRRSPASLAAGVTLLTPPPPSSSCCPHKQQLASGEVFGKNQPIALQLLGSDRSREALEGVAMELEDSLYPLLREVCFGGVLLTTLPLRSPPGWLPLPALRAALQACPLVPVLTHCSRPCVLHMQTHSHAQVSISTDPYAVFKDAEWALMIGAKPRGPGQERADLLDQNGRIFVEQVRAQAARAMPLLPAPFRTAAAAPPCCLCLTLWLPAAAPPWPSFPRACCCVSCRARP
jgi:hypothetical protein